MKCPHFSSVSFYPPIHSPFAPSLFLSFSSYSLSLELCEWNAKKFIRNHTDKMTVINSNSYQIKEVSRIPNVCDTQFAHKTLKPVSVPTYMPRASAYVLHTYISQQTKHAFVERCELTTRFDFVCFDDNTLCTIYFSSDYNIRENPNMKNNRKHVDYCLWKTAVNL